MPKSTKIYLGETFILNLTQLKKDSKFKTLIND